MLRASSAELELPPVKQIHSLSESRAPPYLVRTPRDTRTEFNSLNQIDPNYISKGLGGYAFVLLHLRPRSHDWWLSGGISPPGDRLSVVCGSPSAAIPRSLSPPVPDPATHSRCPIHPQRHVTTQMSNQTLSPGTFPALVTNILGAIWTFYAVHGF